METLDKKKRSEKTSRVFLALEILLVAIILLAIVVIIWSATSFANPWIIISLCGLVIFIAFVIFLRLLFDPESIRANQTDLMLKISSEMVDLMGDGMTPEAAQGICLLLLPRTAAIAVAITDKENILGYAGYRERENPQGAAIRTQATHDTLEDGTTRILYTPEEIGLSKDAKLIRAAIIVPIKFAGEIVGTLKFYYKSAHRITETQKSIAQGLAKLLSTEVAASKLEEQRELATSMELKMLQSQINPHFLFNTINTIASLIRTDPPKARDLLREFAVFYRATLENSGDQIELSRELEQTLRYFTFEVARFGDERLGMEVDLDSGMNGVKYDVRQMQVPPFLLQPIVENAVKHAMPAEGKLTVLISAEAENDDVLIKVEDDGVGMDEDTKNNIMAQTSSTGLGIAVKNVHDRMHGFYGPDAEMRVESKVGEGTTVTLRFPNIIIVS